MAKKYQAQVKSEKWKKAVPALCVIGFFLIVCLSSYSAIKGTALFCVALALVAGIIGFSRLRERFHLPMTALTLFVLMGGASTFYAVSGKFALQEFLKVLVAFCLSVAFLALTKGENVQAGRRIAFVLESGAALASLVSIDLLSTRWISGAVTAVLGLFSSDFANLGGVEAGVRMISLFQNPNVFAGCIGICVLLSLGLVLSAHTERERMGHTVCLYINALAFVLAFSMGAIAFVAVAFLVYLVLEQKDRRAALFVLMAETLVLTLVSVALVAMTSLDAWDGVQLVPLLCLVLGAAALCAVDKFVGRRISTVLENHSRALLIIIAIALVAIVAFVLLAYNMTGSTTLNAGESLRRSAYPEPGEYTLEVQSSGALDVSIATQNEHDTMMHTETVLYNGSANGAAFTVPEDSLVVWFNFSSPDGVAVDSVTCQGVQSLEVPLGYKLLPGFIANRLQGLFANQNAIQRTVFFEDGMKIFARSPIVGLGLGSYENGIASVQSFFYETKYAHNHYIQTLAETGVIGLVFFLGLLIISAVAVLLERRKKEQSHPMTAALGAALVFMAGHALVEMDFSFYAYLPFAFGTFALISLCCGEAVSVKWFSKKVRTWFLSVTAILITVFAGFLISNMMASHLVEKVPTFDSLERAAKMDVFERNDYMLSYVFSADNVADVPQVQEKAQKYAAQLTEANSNTIPIYLAEYYLQQGQVEQGLAMAEKYVRYVSSSEAAWNQAFEVLSIYYDSSELYHSGVARIASVLEEWTANNLGTITLDVNSKAFLDSIGIAITEQ